MAQPVKNSKFLPLLNDELNEDLKLKAQMELNETDEKVQQGLDALKLLIAEETLPVSSEDAFLLAFLRVRKFRIEEAKKSLRRYAAARRKYLQYFAQLHFSTTEPYLDRNACGLLPYRDADGTVILYCREGLYPEKFRTEDYLNYIVTLLHFMLEYPASSISGFRVIADYPMKRVSNYLAYVKVSSVFFQILLSLPIRMKEIDVVNESRLTRAFVAVIWPFIPTKIQQRFQLHGKNLKSLAKRFDPSILPREFGGTLGHVDNEFFKDKFRDFYRKMKSHNILFGT